MTSLKHLCLAFATAFAVACHGIDGDEVSRIRSTLNVQAGDRVADVGAGDGDLTVHLSRWVGDSGRVYATEIDEDAIRALTGRFANAGNVTVVRVTTESANLPPGCCGALLMRNVYHHLTRPDQTLGSLYDALEPGGRFLVIDFRPSWLLSPWTPEGLPEDRSGHGITPELIQREAQDRGFEVERVISSWDQGMHDGFAIVLRRGRAPAAFD